MDSEEKRPQFGSRYLTDPDQAFQQNAWDDVEWDAEQETAAMEKVQGNSKNLMEPEKAEKFENHADQFWNSFYNQHNVGFFKDRNWLFTEFPVLIKWNNSDESPSFKILEVGCGVGNTVFPLLEANNSPNFFVYCCDFSPVAVEFLKKNESYDSSRCKAFVWDITKIDSNLEDFPLEENSLDVILMIFVLSAVPPPKMQTAVNNLTRFLKPGGLLLFRDYGRYDLAQLRFKNGKCISDNFYVRGDGTCVYFFTQDELNSIFTNAHLVKEVNHIDRRLQVNRLKQLKMYRVWIQCNYRKPQNIL